MKFKVFNIIFLILTIFLSFFTYNFFQNPKYITTFQSYSSPLIKINKETVEEFFSPDLEIKEKAEKKILQTTLTVLNYQKWQEFIDYIEVKLYLETVLPKDSKQLIVVLNLSKDLAVVTIFEEVYNEYVFYDKIENLLPVDKIEFLMPFSNICKMMLIYQTLDEKFGSYFIEKFLQAYLYIDNSFKKVWHKTLYYEEIYKEVWVNPQAEETLWNRVVEETVIDFIQEKTIKVNTLTTLEKYETHSSVYPNIDKFKLIYRNNYKQYYYWSKEFNTFILGEAAKDVFLLNSALLEDMENRREFLYGVTNTNNIYKLITSKGEILYLPKNKFQWMFQSFLEE